MDENLGEIADRPLHHTSEHLKCRICKMGFLLVSELQKHQVKHYRKMKPETSEKNKSQDVVSHTKVISSTDISSPLQKDSGIDDCSPVSNEGFVDSSRYSNSKLVYPTNPVSNTEVSENKSCVIDLTLDSEDEVNPKNDTGSQIMSHTTAARKKLEKTLKQKIVISNPGIKKMEIKNGCKNNSQISKFQQLSKIRIIKFGSGKFKSQVVNKGISSPKRSYAKLNSSHNVPYHNISSDSELEDTPKVKKKKKDKDKNTLTENNFIDLNTSVESIDLEDHKQQCVMDKNDHSVNDNDKPGSDLVGSYMSQCPSVTSNGTDAVNTFSCENNLSHNSHESTEGVDVCIQNSPHSSGFTEDEQQRNIHSEDFINEEGSHSENTGTNNDIVNVENVSDIPADPLHSLTDKPFAVDECSNDSEPHELMSNHKGLAVVDENSNHSSMNLISHNSDHLEAVDSESNESSIKSGVIENPHCEDLDKLDGEVDCEPSHSADDNTLTNEQPVNQMVNDKDDAQMENCVVDSTTETADKEVKNLFESVLQNAMSTPAPSDNTTRKSNENLFDNFMHLNSFRLAGYSADTEEDKDCADALDDSENNNIEKQVAESILKSTSPFDSSSDSMIDNLFERFGTKIPEKQIQSDQLDLSKSSAIEQLEMSKQDDTVQPEADQSWISTQNETEQISWSHNSSVDSKNQSSDKNIFELLSKDATLQNTPVNVSSNHSNLDATDPSSGHVLNLSPNKKELNTSSDFESATGESQFNFYDSTTAVSAAPAIIDDVMLNDCYMDIGADKTTLPFYSSHQSDSDDLDSFQGDTPSKCITLSEAQTPIRDSLLGDSIVASPSRTLECDSSEQSSGLTVGFQDEFTRFLHCDKVRNQQVQKAAEEYYSSIGDADNSSESVHYSHLPENFITSTKEQCMSSRQEKMYISGDVKLRSLRRRVCRLLHNIFPEIEYPKCFRTTSVCVESMLDQVAAILKGLDCQKSQAIPTEHSCNEVRVVLCKSPRHCIQNLRRKIVHLLQAVLPDLYISPKFNRSGEMVDELLKKVIMLNKNAIQHVQT